jgi:transcriptional regulator with XRE-family HTH domain
MVVAVLTGHDERVDDMRIPPRIVAGDFSGWLRDAMAARRLSTRALAMRTGLDHSTIYRLALGARAPSLATAVALLRILGADPPRPRVMARRSAG